MFSEHWLNPRCMDVCKGRIEIFCLLELSLSAVSMASWCGGWRGYGNSARAFVRALEPQLQFRPVSSKIVSCFLLDIQPACL